MKDDLLRAAIETELELILTSRLFSRSPKLSAFLRFVVELTLEGRAEDIKEYAIGVQVFERGELFDPRVDPIVRVQAGKLRERLDRYYYQNGARANLRIALRRGSYVPVFQQLQRVDRPPAGIVSLPDSQPAREPSVAVLPFLNLTGDPEFEYFSDGLSEELISVIGRRAGLPVVARTSSFSFKGKSTTLVDIGRALRTDFILEGSVRQTRDALRITAFLNEVHSGHQIWTRQYDCPMEDVFAIQDEIAAQIAASLGQRVRRQAPPAPAPSLDSRLLLLRAWYHWHKATPESLGKAIAAFEQAIEADPANARAHAGLAFAWTVIAVFGAVPGVDARQRASVAAEQALQHDPGLAEVWGAVGCVESVLAWNWSAAETAFLRALELDPHHASSRHGYAIGLLVGLGRSTEVLDHMKVVLDLDPLSLMASCDMGSALSYAGRYEEARQQYLATLELEPNHARTWVELGWMMALQGRAEEGVSASRRGLDLDPLMVGLHGFVAAKAGRRQEALDALEASRRLAPDGAFRWNFQAFALDALGHRQQALDELERSYQQGNAHLRYINVDPCSDALRGEPRFQELIRKMGFPGPGGPNCAKKRLP